MNYIHKFLSTQISDDSSILDIGCGIKDYSMFGKCTTVDAWDKVNPDYLLNLENEKLPFDDNSFDYILLIDFIEHLNKDKGLIVLNDCKRIVKNKIFLFTPLIFDTNEDNCKDINCWAYGNEFNYHKSLWTMDDFIDWEQIIKNTDNYQTFWGYWEKKK